MNNSLILLLKTIAAICVVIIIIIATVFVYRFSNMPSETETFACGTSAAEQIALSPEEAAGELLFNANCTPCHAINERVVGPPLRDAGKRHSRKWLIGFIRNAPEMIRKQDPKAVRIYKEYNEMSMPPFTKLNDEEILSILAYIAKYSSQSQP